jgi:hypothetical protein
VLAGPASGSLAARIGATEDVYLLRSTLTCDPSSSLPGYGLSPDVWFKPMRREEQGYQCVSGPPGHGAAYAGGGWEVSQT